VIGHKILSGRTKDKNIGCIAEYPTALGIDLKEVRVAGDKERAIVNALNAPRHRYTANSGLIVTGSGLATVHRDLIVTLAARTTARSLLGSHARRWRRPDLLWG
jgi:molybdopterin-biosynthesis enzyme MoeA-like protein